MTLPYMSLSRICILSSLHFSPARGLVARHSFSVTRTDSHNPLLAFVYALSPTFSFLCHWQVMDLGICRTLTTGVHSFAHELAGSKKLLHGTAGETVRIANKRFLFASRTHRVPSIFPG